MYKNFAIFANSGITTIYVGGPRSDALLSYEPVNSYLESRLERRSSSQKEQQICDIRSDLYLTCEFPSEYLIYVFNKLTETEYAPAAAETL